MLMRGRLVELGLWTVRLHRTVTFKCCLKIWEVGKNDTYREFESESEGMVSCWRMVERTLGEVRG